MKALELTDLQAAFHDRLLNLSSTIEHEVLDGGRIGVEHRSHIYHHAYRARLLENLHDAYEKTCAYLGDAIFESSALALLKATRPGIATCAGTARPSLNGSPTGSRWMGILPSWRLSTGNCVLHLMGRMPPRCS